MERVKKLVVSAVILLLTMAMLPINIKVETQSIPTIEDPTPGYWETSEFLIGSVAVGIILPESNGTIDPSTEDWTDEEIEKVLSEIQIALDWWASQNPNANVSFITEVHTRVPTSYEPINHTIGERFLWISEVMTYLGYPLLPGLEPKYQVRDYVNGIRSKYDTDWAFAIFVVDSSNDDDGVFKEGGAAAAVVGGPYLFMTYDNVREYVGIENMDKVCAHEIGNIFMAADEYTEVPIYRGYLNVSSIPLSGCIMDAVPISSWCLSGRPHGENGTWGQVSWRDRNNDGIPGIVDTKPTIYLNSPEKIGNTLNYTGVAAVTPYPNRNPWTNNPDGRRNVTTNKIQRLQFRVDNGTWMNATMRPTTLQKLMKYPDHYVTKNTTAIVDFNFTTPTLSPGEHFIEVRGVNSVGNEGYTNDTVTIPEVIHDIAITDVTPQKTVVCQGYNMTINVTAENQGDVTETFNVTLYWNTTEIETKEITLTSGHSTTITFTWNTTGLIEYKNYTLSAYAHPVPGETDTTHNTSIDGLVLTIHVGDVNIDEKVRVDDILTVAMKFGSNLGNPDFDPITDINCDDKVRVDDILVTATEFGWTKTGVTNTDDNTFIDGIVTIVHPGDVNADKKVDMRDVGFEASKFGCNYPDSCYEPEADINDDDKIDMKDIAIAAKNFGYVAS